MNIRLWIVQGDKIFAFEKVSKVETPASVGFYRFSCTSKLNKQDYYLKKNFVIMD